MTFTYTPGLDTPLNWTREVIADTVNTVAQPALFQDEVINAVLAKTGNNVIKTCITLCTMLVFRFASSVSEAVGATRVDFQQKWDHYKELLEMLKVGGTGLLPGGDGSGVATVAIMAGGLSKSGNQSLADNTDATQPNFSVGRDDNPGSGQTGPPPASEWDV